MPEPLAERLTVLPDILLPRLTLLLPAVVDRDKVPEAAMAPEVVSPALLDTLILLPEEPPLPMFKVEPPEAAQVTLPEVLNVKLLVVPVRVLISPEPELRFKLVAARLAEPPV